MKNVFKRITIGISFVLVLSSSIVNAQNYRTGLGVRLGPFSGFTIKHFIQRDKALEGLATFRWDGFVVTGLYEYQKPLQGVRNLDWFIGIGGHTGFWDHGYYYRDHYYQDDTSVAIGMDLIGGFEYTFEEVPISLALDWKPAFNFVGGPGFWSDGLALSVRYAIK